MSAILFKILSILQQCLVSKLVQVSSVPMYLYINGILSFCYMHEMDYVFCLNCCSCVSINKQRIVMNSLCSHVCGIATVYTDGGARQTTHR